MAMAPASPPFPSPWLEEIYSETKMRVAVIGGGVSGLVSAYILAKAGVHVVLYEKEDHLGGHAQTIHVNGVDLDLGFMVFNGVTYPNMMELFENLGVNVQRSDMSFSVSLDEGRTCEWGSRNGLSSLFAQKKNAFRPSFYRMLREIIKFKSDVLRYLEQHENNLDLDRSETLGQFIKSLGYSDAFRDHYFVSPDQPPFYLTSSCIDNHNLNACVES
ncbi:Zeta-carotene desaturase [Nymphaea thermarum]|nr:Zeta-carotene desaturase [Nymphaea thermarum]